MAADVEVCVVFPAGKTNIKRRQYHALEVAGNKRQLRLDKLHASFERDLALKHAQAGYIEGHALAFKMEENGVAPGKAVTLLKLLHVSSPNQCGSSVKRSHLSSRTKIETQVSPALALCKHRR